MEIENVLEGKVKEAIVELYNVDLASVPAVTVQKTRKEFKGDFTVVVFPFLKISKKSPDDTAAELGKFLAVSMPEMEDYNVVKGFLNISLQFSYWLEFYNRACSDDQFGLANKNSGRKMMVEYSSPNTNKPLHLGHLRNNFLGNSISRILQANGDEVIKTQIINDRGVHICKSMLAWQRWGNGETPSGSGIKGDHLVGKYYIIFDQRYKAEITEVMKEGLTKEEAEQQAPLMVEVREMLKKWEAGDPETVELWKTMNGWVYEGFEQTYQRMGVSFDNLYYESDTYHLGKDEVLNAVEEKIFFRKEDGSVWADLTNDGLDEKILLRKDGTSVYMTQDIGTAILRFREAGKLNGVIYVVGNEQDYHFKALFLILKKLGFDWANECYHLSYGMVDLPEGKMKSREGTVVDADNLMEEMTDNARLTALELGKLDDFSQEEKDELYDMVGMAALKYFILKVDPKKRMLFDPKESIDFNGNTGPFIQYTYARIRSIMRKAASMEIVDEQPPAEMTDQEMTIIRLVHDFPPVIKQAGNELNPALIANYVYELVKAYNHYYQTTPILKEGNKNNLSFRLGLSELVAKVIEKGMGLLGISVPERM